MPTKHSSQPPFPAEPDFADIAVIYNDKGLPPGFAVLEIQNVFPDGGPVYPAFRAGILVT